MSLIGRGKYTIGPATAGWTPPAFDGGPFDPRCPFLFGAAQGIGIWDTRPTETPEQPEVHKTVGWTPADGGVTLRVSSPRNSGVVAVVPPLPSALHGAWPPGFTLRLWVGGVDWFETLNDASASSVPDYFSSNTPNAYANQLSPGGLTTISEASSVTGALRAMLASGNTTFDVADVTANPRKRAIFGQLLSAATTFDLHQTLSGTTGLPIEIDLSALAGRCRYVWAALDVVALPPPQLQMPAPTPTITPRWLLYEGNTGGTPPNIDVLWTVRSGLPSGTTIEPSEVRVLSPHELWDPPVDMGPADLALWPSGQGYLGEWTPGGVSFSARACRGRRRFYCYSNGFYNRLHQNAFGSLFARVTTSNGQHIVDVQRPDVYAVPNLAVTRDPDAQPTMHLWGPIEDADDASPVTAGHVGQASGVTIEFLGIRNFSTDIWPWDNAPGLIVTLGA